MTDQNELVHRVDDRGIVTVTLDSPANRNALSARLVAELVGHLDAVATDDTVRAVVLTHTGNTFCAGADLAESAREGGPAEGTRRLVELLRRILELPVPVVGRVDGHVRAGGTGIVGACDVVVAGPATTFAFTEVRLALAPAIISLTVLPRLTDRAAARWFLTGDRFDGHEAERIGLVTTATDDPDGAVALFCDSFRAGAPQGLAETKRLTTAALLAAFDTDAERLTERSGDLFASEDAREGIAAFLAKRPPRWAAPG